MMVKNTEHEVYSLWCDFYSSEESREGVEHLRSLLDDMAENTTLEIKNKILEKSGYSEVFDKNNTIDGSSFSEYNQSKDAVHSKLRNN